MSWSTCSKTRRETSPSRAIPSPLGDILGRDAACLAAKARDHVIGDRRKLGVYIARTEWRHVNVLVFEMIFRAVHQDLRHICAVGIGHRSATGQ